ncbi:hypothetical protein SPRG_13727 [Saprolegnia parasitica CBS 223.65]|uniref:FZ domain-containing protein n=1 Tax=Saprolegnia parasitica (strain CBS 223.65) TaxID=695850 RepID=A0A067C367_SAPPC|nr:hypothetical protein SPRG_13727 [Saprolegnia parasitica CBS 223.65]KDO21227.1 hypothetical protein SPRG_13727 [Saprolegnia parasitica CBS 223.65]|eukprot:XP_012208060.1 hypothetical protein SPRG_13727 [Saprolegnia parasitica CBS 223.65]
MVAAWKRLLLAGAAIVAAYECPNSCGTPSGLGFCQYIDFPTCRLQESWDDQDVLAAKAFMALVAPAANSTYLDEDGHFAGFDNVIATKHEFLLNTTHECHVLLRRIQCGLHFPICEIGSEFSRMCFKSCRDTVKLKCPELTGICNDEDPALFESDNKCFQVSYSGPAVGMWIAGFSISLVFSILNSVGINLQKYSLTQNEKLGSQKGSFQQPMWVLGLVFVCLGSILDFVAFGMAPQTLLAPLAALSLVWNMLIAPFFHKEKVTRRNLVATCIIFFGVTLTVIFAGHSTPAYDLEDLIKLYQTPVMYFYIVSILLFLITLFASTRYIETNHLYEDGLFHIVCYGGIAGTFGGQSVLLAKSTVELLKSAIWGDGADAFKHPATYAIISGLVVCLLCQITFLNGGLKRFDALVVIPVYQSFWILTSVLGGIMYFEEYISMTQTEMVMFTMGGVVTISGIIYLLQDTQSSGAPSGKYLELAHAATPSDAWNADDSDEEVHQQQLDDDLEDPHGSPTNRQTQVSPTDGLFNDGDATKKIKPVTSPRSEFI